VAKDMRERRDEKKKVTKKEKKNLKLVVEFGLEKQGEMKFQLEGADIDPCKSRKKRKDEKKTDGKFRNGLGKIERVRKGSRQTKEDVNYLPDGVGKEGKGRK